MRKGLAWLCAFMMAFLPAFTALAEGEPITETIPVTETAPAEEAAPAEAVAEAEPEADIPVSVEAEPADEVEASAAAEPEAEVVPEAEPTEAEAPFTASEEATVSPFQVEGDTLLSYTGHEERVSVPEGIRRIAARAFANNADLKELNLPDTVEEIGDSAFANCVRLEKVTARKLKKIGSRAFTGCKKLEDISFADEVESVAADAFDAAIALPEAPAQAAIVISTQPGDVSVVPGGTATFTVKASGTSLSYQWQTKLNATAAWANTGLNGNKTTSLSFTVPGTDYDGRLYRCVITDANGNTKTSAEAELSVSSFAITTQPASRSVAEGSTATFTVRASGSGLSYQWQTKLNASAAWANTGLTGNKTAKLSFTPTAAYNGRQYRCVITNANGATLTSNAATLTVTTAKTVSISPQATTVNAGDTVTVTATATGVSSYQWQTRLSSSAAWANTGLTGSKTAKLTFTPTAAYHSWQLSVSHWRKCFCVLHQPENS